MRARTKMFAVAALAAGLAAGAVFTANAASMADGQWCTGTGADAGRYWFTLEPDGSRCVANTWEWIKDSDGVVRCYYFDQQGWVVTNTTVGEYTVDADGRWVQNGQVVTAGEDTNYYTHNANFINSGKTETKTPAAGGSNTQTSTGNKAGGPIKSSTGKGDDPSLYTGAPLGYAVSTVSGKTISNSWANFTMTFPASSGTIFVGGADEGFDVQNLYNDAQLTIRYVPINHYGGSTIDNFIAGYVQDGQDGMKGAALGADVQFGDFTFKQVSIKVPNPSAAMYDHAYFRVVDGTGYVQVITVIQNGSTENFSSTLSTMKKLA